MGGEGRRGREGESVRSGERRKLSVETACGLYTFGLYAKEGEFHSRFDSLIWVLMLSQRQAVAMRKTASQPSTSTCKSQHVQLGASLQPSILEHSLERTDGEKVSQFPAAVAGNCKIR